MNSPAASRAAARVLLRRASALRAPLLAVATAGVLVPFASRVLRPRRRRPFGVLPVAAPFSRSASPSAAALDASAFAGEARCPPTGRMETRALLLGLLVAFASVPQSCDRCAPPPAEVSHTAAISSSSTLEAASLHTRPAPSQCLDAPPWSRSAPPLAISWTRFFAILNQVYDFGRPSHYPGPLNEALGKTAPRLQGPFTHSASDARYAPSVPPPPRIPRSTSRTTPGPTLRSAH